MRTRNNYFDNSQVHQYPDKIEVHEHRATTDESIRYMEEVHDKAIKNIIAKFRFNEDNIVTGDCFVIETAWDLDFIRIFVKLKINGKEFTIEKQISRQEAFIEQHNGTMQLNKSKLRNLAEAFMLKYLLGTFVEDACEKILSRQIS